MNKSCTEEIEGYIKRSIADIARKCGVSNTDVIETIKNLYKNENKFYKRPHEPSA